MSQHHERVAVLMGGWTAEASVSRVSASFADRPRGMRAGMLSKLKSNAILPPPLRNLNQAACLTLAWSNW